MDPLVMTLRGLQASANNQGSAAPMTWKALSAITRDQGAPFLDYNGFDARWKQEEQLPPEQQILHNLVDRYDGAGLVIKTNNKEQTARGPSDENQAKKKIGQMARHAMK